MNTKAQMACFLFIILILAIHIQVLVQRLIVALGNCILEQRLQLTVEARVSEVGAAAAELREVECLNLS
jgi:hypothetical protein